VFEAWLKPSHRGTIKLKQIYAMGNPRWGQSLRSFAAVQAAWVILDCMSSEGLVETIKQPLPSGWPSQTSPGFSTSNPYVVPEIPYGAPPPPQCKVKQLNMFLRHGNRNPDPNRIVQIKEVLKSIRAQAASIKPEYQWMLEWEIPKPWIEKVYLETPSGLANSYWFGERLRNHLPEIFDTEYSPIKYDMRFAAAPRVGSTATAFAEGVWNHAQGLPRPEAGDARTGIYMHSVAWNEDIELRFFDHCPKYAATTGKALREKTLPVPKAYREAAFPAMAEDLFKRTGWNPAQGITAQLGVETVYTICLGYVMSGSDDMRWCNMLTVDDVARINYYLDMQEWYGKGWGDSINYAGACTMVKRWFEKMDLYISGQNTETRAWMLFGNGDEMIPLFASLGILGGQDLSATWNIKQIKEREFNLSKYLPFGASMMFVLYECGGTWMVKFLLNEVATPLPGCDGQVYCPYEKLKAQYKEQIDGCDMCSACGYECPAPPPPSTFSFSPLATIALLGWLVAFILGFLFFRSRSLSGYESVPNSPAGASYQRSQTSVMYQDASAKSLNDTFGAHDAFGNQSDGVRIPF